VDVVAASTRSDVALFPPVRVRPRAARVDATGAGVIAAVVAAGTRNPWHAVVLGWFGHPLIGTVLAGMASVCVPWHRRVRTVGAMVAFLAAAIAAAACVLALVVANAFSATPVASVPVDGTDLTPHVEEQPGILRSGYDFIVEGDRGLASRRNEIGRVRADDRRYTVHAKPGSIDIGSCTWRTTMTFDPETLAVTWLEGGPDGRRIDAADPDLVLPLVHSNDDCNT